MSHKQQQYKYHNTRKIISQSKINLNRAIYNPVILRSLLCSDLTLRLPDTLCLMPSHLCFCSVHFSSLYLFTSFLLRSLTKTARKVLFCKCCSYDDFPSHSSRQLVLSYSQTVIAPMRRYNYNGTALKYAASNRTINIFKLFLY